MNLPNPTYVDTGRKAAAPANQNDTCRPKSTPIALATLLSKSIYDLVGRVKASDIPRVRHIAPRRMAKLNSLVASGRGLLSSSIRILYNEAPTVEIVPSSHNVGKEGGRKVTWLGYMTIQENKNRPESQGVGAFIVIEQETELNTTNCVQIWLKIEQMSQGVDRKTSWDDCRLKI